MLSSPCNQPSYIEHISNLEIYNLQKNLVGEDDTRDLLIWDLVRTKNLKYFSEDKKQ